LRREKLNIYREGGEKLEWKVKNKIRQKTRESNDNNEVYQINCKV
jgi:hypothetical protein